MQQLKRDGIALCYEEAGKGAPPILLVHGLAGDHTFMTPQFEHFRRTHRVVSVDLRGHGQSEKPQQEYTIAGFADDLAWLCRELGLYKPVLIGHSLGGMIVLDLAARYPDVPVAIVALDATIVPPAGTEAWLQPVTQGLRTPAYREVLRQFMELNFAPTDDPQRKARLVDQMASAPQHGRACSPGTVPQRLQPVRCPCSILTLERRTPICSASTNFVHSSSLARPSGPGISSSLRCPSKSMP